MSQMQVEPKPISRYRHARKSPQPFPVSPIPTLPHGVTVLTVTPIDEFCWFFEPYLSGLTTTLCNWCLTQFKSPGRTCRAPEPQPTLVFCSGRLVRSGGLPGGGSIAASLWFPSHLSRLPLLSLFVGPFPPPLAPSLPGLLSVWLDQSFQMSQLQPTDGFYLAHMEFFSLYLN